MTCYRLQVFLVYSDCWQLTETKRFHSIWLFERYKAALRNRYEGDKFAFRLFA
jgi:hypothetical protein